MYKSTAKAQNVYLNPHLKLIPFLLSRGAHMKMASAQEEIFFYPVSQDKLEVYTVSCVNARGRTCN